MPIKYKEKRDAYTFIVRDKSVFSFLIHFQFGYCSVDCC